MAPLLYRQAIDKINSLIASKQNATDYLVVVLSFDATGDHPKMFKTWGPKAEWACCRRPGETVACYSVKQLQKWVLVKSKMIGATNV